MDRVFILYTVKSTADYQEFFTEGVYSTREKAEAAKSLLSDRLNPWIEEEEVQ